MRETIDNAPKNGDFVRYIEQLEKEQFRNVAVMMERTQTRGPGEVKVAARANPASTQKSPTKPAGPTAKLTAAQAQKVAEMLSTGNTPRAGGKGLDLLAQRFSNRADIFFAIRVSIVLIGLSFVFAYVTNTNPSKVTALVLFFIWVNYFRKSKKKA